MMILGVGVLIIVAIGLGIYFGLFHNQDNVVGTQQTEDQSRLLIDLIQSAVTQSTKFIE